MVIQDLLSWMLELWNPTSQRFVFISSHQYCYCLILPGAQQVKPNSLSEVTVSIYQEWFLLTLLHQCFILGVYLLLLLIVYIINIIPLDSGAKNKQLCGVMEHFCNIVAHRCSIDVQNLLLSVRIRWFTLITWGLEALQYVKECLLFRRQSDSFHIEGLIV